MKKRLKKGAPAKLLCNMPAYCPKRGTRLINIVESSLAEEYGQKLKLRDLAAISGQSISTLFGWRTDAKLEQIETLLCLLERLPESRRLEIFNQACRVLPTLSHYAVAWNEDQAGTLETLLLKDSGLTIIQGKDNAVGFLATAFGHSNLRRGFNARPVCGVDYRSTERFVPVDGVVYVQNPLEPERIRECVVAAWPAIRNRTGHLVLLVGCLAHMRDFHRELLALVERCHVVVAEQSEDAVKLRRCSGLPGHIVTVKQERDGRISAGVQCVR